MAATNVHANIPTFLPSSTFDAYPGYGSSKLASILNREPSCFGGVPSSAVNPMTGYPVNGLPYGPFAAASPAAWLNTPFGAGNPFPGESSIFSPSPMTAPWGRFPGANWTGVPSTIIPGNYGTVCPTTFDAMMGPSVYGYGRPMISSPSSLPLATSSIFGGCPTPAELYAIENSWWINSGFRACNPVEAYTLNNPVRFLDRDGNREIFLCVELKGYKPEEIQVTLNKTERCILIEATQDAKDGKEHHIARKYSRKVFLPESLAKCDLSKCELRSCLNVDGTLIVECTLPKMTTEEIAKCPTMSRIASLPLYYNYPTMGYNHPGAMLPSTGNVRPVTVKTA